jgi:hypothetical protein
MNSDGLVPNDRRRLEADGPEFLGQSLHRCDAPGGKNQVVTVDRFARQTSADAAAGAGDEGKGARGLFMAAAPK